MRGELELTTLHDIFPDLVSQLRWEGEQAAVVGGGGVGRHGCDYEIFFCCRES